MNQTFEKLPPAIVLWGGTGQAKVIAPTVELLGSRVVAVVDDTPDLAPPFPGIPLLKGAAGLKAWLDKQSSRTDLGFAVTIGNPHGRVRLKLHDIMVDLGLQPTRIVHPSAWVEHNAVIGPGAQIMHHAVVMAQASIGRQCIINTCASLDHESILSDGCELAPGATLCGLIRCGTNVWVCAGATILPRVHIGDDAIVGAGSLVRKNVPEKTTVIGVPARVINRNPV